MKKVTDFLSNLMDSLGFWFWVIVAAIIGVFSWLIVDYLQTNYPNEPNYPVYYGIGLIVVCALLLFNPFQYLKK